MHMSDALISPGVGAVFWAVSGTTIVHSARKLQQEADEKKVPLMGVLGAFVFAAQMINFTIPGTGSSGHLGGGMILAILLGPHAGFLTLASVLVIQALFFGDGGLLALGCNIFNMGVWTCFVAYPLVYRRFVKPDSSSRRIVAGALVSVVVAMQLGPLSVVVQTLLSGISELPFRSFLLLMQPIHLAIGIVEGVVTAGFVMFVKRARPDILESAGTAGSRGPVSVRKVILGLAVVTLVTGGMLSWFASTHPDGLEWAIQKVSGRSQLSGRTKGITGVLKAFQEKTALLPDYGFKREEVAAGGSTRTGEEGGGVPSSTAVSPGKSVAGIVGSLVTFGLALLVGVLLKRRARVRPRT